MIPTLVCVIIFKTFFTDLASGIPVQSPILISPNPILRRSQNFNSRTGKKSMSDRIRQRVERSTTVQSEGGRRQICEVQESHIQLTSDLAVTARVCKTPGTQPRLGEGYTCAQDHLSLSFSGTSTFVPSGCSLRVMDSLRAEPSPLTVDELRFQGLELSSGLQMVAEHRFCESLGENNGNYRLGGREYSCHQQHLIVKSGQELAPLPSGCRCYLNSL